MSNVKMQQSGTNGSQMPVQHGDEDTGEDIQYTDWESESEYSVTTSDIDFIDPREDFHEIGDYDPSYNDPDELSLSISSDNGINDKLWDIGEDDEISVLDERKTEGTSGRVTQLLIQCWVEESIVQDILDLIRVSRRGIVE